METNCMDKKRHPFARFMRFIGFGILGAAAIVGFGFLFGFFVMMLWNWLMPVIFGLGLINFWQAVGLVVLSRLLIGGFPHRRHHSHKPWDKHKCSDKNGDWKRWKYYGQYWKEKGEASFSEYIRKQEEGTVEEPKV